MYVCVCVCRCSLKSYNSWTHAHEQPVELATQATSYLRGGGGAHNDDGTLDLPQLNNDVYFNAITPNPLAFDAFNGFVGVFTSASSITFNQLSSVLSAFLFMAFPGIFPVGKAMPTQPMTYTGEVRRG